MEKPTVNPEAELPARPRDTKLSTDQLESLSVFASLKKQPSFLKNPGTCILRHYRAGEVICQQGEAGGTAFYLLTRADVDALAAPDSPDPAADTQAPSLDEGFRELLQDVRNSLKIAANQTVDAPFQLATARLMVDTSRGTLLHPVRFLQSLWRRPPTVPDAMMNPSSIPNDGPADIDYTTRQAPMYEGEVFGEMSCMNRQPRSATVVASIDCFVLEFLRNMLEQLQRDKPYNDLMEKKYRERALELHLRRLSMFQLLSPEDFKSIKDKVELVKFVPGTVLWDEGDEANELYVVRTGMVQVVQSFPWRLTESAVRDWPNLLNLLANQNADPAVERLRKALSKELLDALAQAGTEPTSEVREKLVNELNALAKTETLLTAKETQAARLDAHYVREKSEYPKKEKKWTGLQLRRANRILFQILFGDAVAPAEPAGAARVLDYVGRGGVLGEIALIRNQPRSATCMTFSHTDADREATDVELVRVSKELVAQIASGSPRVRSEIEKLIETRIKHSEKVAKLAVGPMSESRRAQELGLLQGQKLMLIDLDRCTRCGDCVQACIDTHDDGHSRLFLDGPRFGKYLVPSSCRQCRDPVCMIGCPVGSIQQGPDKEIRIREWCIGCSLCADQCPYDSIQMHDAATIPSCAPGWLWMNDAKGTIGGNWNRPSFDDRQWRVGVSPFSWGIDFHQDCSSAANGRPNGVNRLYFRYRFRARPNANPGRSIRHQLKIISQGESLEVYINGEVIELAQDPKQKKRSEFTAVFDDSVIRNGDKVLAISLAPPKEFGATLLDARIDTLAPESEEFNEKMVEKRAVVCDQCSSLSGDRSACVYACPHDAAMRINAWVNFPEA